MIHRAVSIKDRHPVPENAKNRSLCRLIFYILWHFTLVRIMASNPLYAIIWLILLLFIAWPIASLLAIVWIVLQVRKARTSHRWSPPSI
jgi:hypothetical protein